MIKKKGIFCVAFIVSMMVLFSGCGHEHTWVDATCTEPRTCTECGETEGEPTGHLWGHPTCTEPKTCKICGATEGNALGHQWLDATCTEPKTCSVCGKTEGTTIDHDWDEGVVKTFTYDQVEFERVCTCKKCGKEK